MSKSNKINTDKKLELVKAIRMQNQYNRQLFRSREGFLYSDTPEMHHGELFSLEEQEKQLPQETGTGNAYGNFRVRFMIAIVLLVSFVLCDVNHLSYKGETTDTIFGRMTSSFDIAGLLDEIKESWP